MQHLGYNHPFAHMPKMNEIQLHNTLSNRLENLDTLHPEEVRIYTCGPTVYDFAHIGNFRTFAVSRIFCGAFYTSADTACCR